jgi:hypothetical protein
MSDNGHMWCCFQCQFCHGARHKHDCMFPSQKMGTSIRTSDIRCLLSTCKIPANSLQNPLLYGALSPGGSSRARPQPGSSTARGCLKNAKYSQRQQPHAAGTDGCTPEGVTPWCGRHVYASMHANVEPVKRTPGSRASRCSTWV